jgi:hypothetical protein
MGTDEADLLFAIGEGHPERGRRVVEMRTVSLETDCAQRRADEDGQVLPGAWRDSEKAAHTDL